MPLTNLQPTGLTPAGETRIACVIHFLANIDFDFADTRTLGIQLAANWPQIGRELAANWRLIGS